MVLRHNKMAIMLVVGLLLPLVSCNLIGFDFGSSFMKATLVQAGKKF